MVLYLKSLFRSLSNILLSLMLYAVEKYMGGGGTLLFIIASTKNANFHIFMLFMKFKIYFIP